MEEIIIRQNQQFKSPELTKATQSLYKAFLNIETGRKEACKILATVEKNKSYTLDGFKSLAEYAEKIGIEKALAHKMENAGRLMLSDIPEVKAFADKADYSKLSILSSAKPEELKTAIESGELKPEMTSKQVTEWKADTKSKSAEAEVLPNYDVSIVYGDSRLVRHQNVPIDAVKELEGFIRVGIFTLNDTKWTFMFNPKTSVMLRYSAVKVKKPAKSAPKIDVSKLSDDVLEELIREHQRRKEAK